MGRLIGPRSGSPRTDKFHFCFVSLSIYIYIHAVRTAYLIFLFGCKMDKMAALCTPVECDSNTRHGQLQMRRKLYETKRTLQPLPRARIKASAEEIAPTILPNTLQNITGPQAK